MIDGFATPVCLVQLDIDTIQDHELDTCNPSTMLPTLGWWRANYFDRPWEASAYVAGEDEETPPWLEGVAGDGMVMRQQVLSAKVEFTASSKKKDKKAAAAVEEEKQKFPGVYTLVAPRFVRPPKKQLRKQGPELNADDSDQCADCERTIAEAPA